MADQQKAATKICPFCSQLNDNNRLNCSQCGKVLPRAVTPTQPRARPILSDPASLEETNITGTPVPQDAPADEETRKSDSKAVVPSAEPSKQRTGTAPAALAQNMGNRLAGRYELIEIIGEGGMGVVYSARDLELREDIAIKLLLPHFTRSPNDVERFKREIVTARKITHPNVIRIHDFGVTQREAFISMELLKGGTLADLMEDPVEFDDAVRMAIGVADGLGEAHRKGVIHRDVKPHNIMFDATGEVKILDFGIARLATAKTTTVGFTGTPFYMAPEQADAKKVTMRSDVYSLGVLMYELFTGRLPFEHESIIQMAMLHATAPVPPPRSVKYDVPVELEQIILKCLQKDPKKRYATGGDVAFALREFTGEISGAFVAPKAPPPEPAKPSPSIPPVPDHTLPGEKRSGNRAPWVFAGVITLAVIVTAAIVFEDYLSTPAATPTPTAVVASVTEDLTLNVVDAKTGKRIAFEASVARGAQMVVFCSGATGSCTRPMRAGKYDFSIASKGYEREIVTIGVPEQDTALIELTPKKQLKVTPKPTPRRTPRQTPKPVVSKRKVRFTSKGVGILYVNGRRIGPTDQHNEQMLLLTVGTHTIGWALAENPNKIVVTDTIEISKGDRSYWKADMKNRRIIRMTKQ